MLDFAHVAGEPMASVIDRDTELKPHLVIEHTDDDAVLSQILAAATAYVEQNSGRQLVNATQTLATRRFPLQGESGGCSWMGGFLLPRSPLVSVTSITYIDTDGVTQTLDASEYRVSVRAIPGRVEPAWNTAWPACRDQAESVVVTYVSGYGDDGSAVPAMAKQAILLLSGTMYRLREHVVTGSVVNRVPGLSGMMHAISDGWRW